MFNPPTLFKEYELNGYLISKRALPSKILLNTLRKIKTAIKQYTINIGVNVHQYLKAISRWNDSSLIVEIAKIKLLSQIQRHVEKLICQEIILVESSVICKNKFANGSIPIHQDISYVGNNYNAYDISIWLPFSDITNDDGGLSVLPSSHENAIEPAVDFWSPSFVNRLDQSENYYKDLVTLNLSIGDIVIFSSKLQHGSKASLSKKDRYIFVTRWRYKGTREKYFIPPHTRDKEFGMWNCSEITKQYLQHMPLVNKDDSFLVILDKWLEILTKKKLSFLDNKQALLSLELVRILHIASQLHHASDAHGVVYQNLYKTLLLPIKNKLRTLTDAASFKKYFY